MKRVALLGPHGTYSHVAAQELYTDLEPVFCTTLGEVVRSDTERTLVPIENSLGGSVGETIDLLSKQRPPVSGARVIDIEHCAATRSSTVGRVRSHPQALDQCRQYIEAQGWETIESPSTARAAADIRDGEAAICSRLAAEHNDLEMMATSVQDERSRTRFLELGGTPTGGGHSVVLIDPAEDRPGLLHHILAAFADADINLTQINSRPTRDGLGTYYFYIEAASGPENPAMQDALVEARSVADIDVLGSYGDQ